MNPIFTVNYPEFVVADYLTKQFPKKSGYSVLIPASSQQKGFDLALMRRHPRGKSKVVTFQVKSSTGWVDTPGVAPRTGLRNFRYYMWLNRFGVEPDVDFYVLLALYAASPTSTKSATGAWKSHMLLFTMAEMTKFLSGVRLRKSPAPDRSFGFGFDHDREAFQTRGHALPAHPDYSTHIIGRRHGMIVAAL